ncbi:methyl-accepting chemotaxis protein [Kamptonema cortianum]|nr:methyl-accepting chemotaxis protein [Oscillatoria laete-virens]MDK3161845.1 methyl-accepting chemotaxis protein [Kamptonema cortianum]MDL5054415.1 methyl-accepting chemotaxis protein [Oscillatoria laete-virens NRMC-F 0139]
MKLSISLKLFSVFLLMIVSILLVGYIGIRGMSSEFDKIRSITGNEVAVAFKVNTVHEELLKMAKNISEHVATDDVKIMEKERELIDESLTRQQQIYDELMRNASLSEEEKRAIKAMIDYENKEILPLKEQMIRLSEQGAVSEGIGAAALQAAQENKREALRVYLEQFNPKLEKLEEMLDGMVSTFQDNVAKEVLDAEKEYEEAKKAIIALIIGAALAAMILSFILSRYIVRSVNEILRVVGLVARGDLSAQTNIRSRDEFGDLSGNVNRMIDDLSGIFTQIRKNSESLSSSSEELAAVSHQLSSNAEETSAQSNVVSAAAEQVSKNVQTVATGIEEMTASIREIAKNANESAKVASNAVSAAEQTNTTVTKLGVSSAEIGNVIKVITSIAEQTNLLALNATIEAARAGEAGKGFAVVANEVKELAKETARATEDISAKISTIQQDTDGAVKAIAEISAIINRINDIQNSIASSVEEQTATTNEISRNVSEAAKGSAQIAQNIVSVAQAAENTSGGANNIQQANKELAQMALDLQKVVLQFKINEQSGGGGQMSGGGGISKSPGYSRKTQPSTISPARSNGLHHDDAKQSAPALSR